MREVRGDSRLVENQNDAGADRFANDWLSATAAQEEADDPGGGGSREQQQLGSYLEAG